MRFRQNAEFLRDLFFAADVHFRGWVFPNPHESEAGLATAFLQVPDAAGEFLLDLAGDGAAVNEVGRGHYSRTWILWMVMIGVLRQRASRLSSPVTIIRMPL